MPKVKGKEWECSRCGYERATWNIPVVLGFLCPVILFYSFAQCHHWGKFGKGYIGSLCVISYNCLRIYNNLKTKSLIKSTIWEAKKDCRLLHTVNILQFIQSAFTVLCLGYNNLLISESTVMNAFVAKFWHIFLLIFLRHIPRNGITVQGLCISPHTFKAPLHPKYRKIQYLEALKLCKYLRCWPKGTFKMMLSPLYASWATKA